MIRNPLKVSEGVADSLPSPAINVLYVGPFVLDTVLAPKAATWRSTLQTQFGAQIEMVIANPPFHVDDIECQGFLG